MHPLIRRYSLVVCLILVGGGAASALRQEAPATPNLPTIEVLTSGSFWRAEAASSAAGSAMAYQQWQLVGASGQQALLYIGVTSRVPTMLRWSGELGYQGEGYVVVDRRNLLVQLGHGKHATAGEATLRHLSERRVIRYAIVGPHGIGREARDLMLGAAWDAVRGHAAAYYLVRVSTSVDSGVAATALFARVLSRLGGVAG
ncbi:MAG TPA: hypothetical protein VKF14_14995 [Candidatus Dormibacteraeota bacterium]|nr:hypothetical protein [Candidatus Dormibacteraeota bacterium]